MEHDQEQESEQKCTAASQEGAAAGDPAANTPGDKADRKLVKRTVAIFTGYVGTAFKGSSINRALGEDVTVEQVVEKAVFKAGLMLESNYGTLRRVNWSRASRTDKGVHSLGTVMGLRMLVDDRCFQLPPAGSEQSEARPPSESGDAHRQGDDADFVPGDTEGIGIARRINRHLPPHVRVFTVQKVNKKFNARHMCCERTYEYYVPVSLLGLNGAPDGAQDSDAATIATFRAALAKFVGTHPFHNYTDREMMLRGGKDRRKRRRAAEGPRKQDKEEVKQDVGQAAAEQPGSDPVAPETPETARVTAPAVMAAPAEAGGSRGGADGDGGGSASDTDGEGGGELDGELDDVDNDQDHNDAPGGEEGEAEGAPPDGAEGAAPTAAQRPRRRRGPLLVFTPEVGAGGPISSTFYRIIKSFTADDPAPLVEGGTRCMRAVVCGQSFMIHHIRHMIGTAVAVARGLIPMEVLEGSLYQPARVALPRAPPHTLLLSDCAFQTFPRQQQGPGDNDLLRVTGPALSLRARGRAEQEAFRRQALLPALQQLVDSPAWSAWLGSLDRAYPWPTEEQACFLDAARQWGEVQREKKERRAAAQHASSDGEGGAEEGGAPRFKRAKTGRGWRGRGRGRGGRRGGG